MAVELTRDSELDRQMKAVRTCETETIVCPWCGVFGNSESGDCCFDMEQGRERLAIEHLKSLERQFNGVRAGTRDSVQCPYCDGINRHENFESPAHWKRPMVSPYCCSLMDAAAVAIGQKAIVQAQIDSLHRIQDGIAKASRN